MSGTVRSAPLPAFTRWATGMWAFVHGHRIYFAARGPAGWTVVAEDDQAVVISTDRTSKARAVRKAMQAIDEADTAPA